MGVFVRVGEDGGCRLIVREMGVWVGGGGVMGGGGGGFGVAEVV